MRIWCVIFFLLAKLYAQELITTVSSDLAHYNGSSIVLEGHVQVENSLWTLSAQKAVFLKSAENQLKLDFSSIELFSNVVVHLQKGHLLECDHVLLDTTTMVGMFTGKPQLFYQDARGCIWANSAFLYYENKEGKLEPIKLVLKGNVEMEAFLEGKNTNKPLLQMALADDVEYYFEDQSMVLKANEHSRVLFYDKEEQMQLSAKTVLARWNESPYVKGLGDVRFIFKKEEMDRLKNRFQWEH